MRLQAELTPREKEVAELLAWGAAKKEVADELDISPRTVENMARSIYHKIGIQKATELCVWWFCTRFKIPINMSPLMRRSVAAMILMVFVPGLFYEGQEKLVRVEKTVRRSVRRRQELEVKTFNLT